MIIETNLPYNHCENCPEFVLNVTEQVLFYGMQSQRQLVVGCKNTNLCRRLNYVREEKSHEEPVQPV